MTILETIPIMEQAGKYDSMFFFALLGASICLFLSGICILLPEDYDIAGDLFGCIGIIILIISLILSATEPITDTGRVKYIVKINNNYPLNEFYDKYKILEHAKYTDIYTVEELND